MFDIHTVELDWGGRKLILETGKVARQADGAVVATYGESKVLATVVAAKQPREGVDFLPLTVDYQEKFYAAGRIPGGYFKREGRPTERETLISRLIDRPVRPLFADGWRCETQIIITTLSHDLENDPDILALVASSAALTLSGAPFKGPIGAARVGFVIYEYVLNPTLEEMAGKPARSRRRRHQGRGADVDRVRGQASCPEEVMLGAVMFGHRHFQPVIKAIIQLAEKAAKEPREVTVIDNSAIEKEMLALTEQDLRTAYAVADKMARHKAVDAAKAKVTAHYFPEGKEPAYDKLRIGGVFKELEAKVVRNNILDTGKRIDGRDLKTVRPIVSEVGILPRAHGSALFTRGETQALVIATCSAPARTSSGSMHCRGRTRSRSCCIITSRPIRSVRPGASAAPSVARSATASLHGARSIRCCRTSTTSPTRSASSRRSPSRTVRPRWRRCAAPRSR